jgi:hypothetical protein
MVFKMILFSLAIVGDGTNFTVIFLFEIVWYAYMIYS